MSEEAAKAAAAAVAAPTAGRIHRRRGRRLAVGQRGGAPSTPLHLSPSRQFQHARLPEERLKPVVFGGGHWSSAHVEKEEIELAVREFDAAGETEAEDARVEIQTLLRALDTQHGVVEDVARGGAVARRVDALEKGLGWRGGARTPARGMRPRSADSTLAPAFP